MIRLEELHQAWPELQRAVCGLSPMPYADATAAARRNPSSHVHYSAYYDDESRRIVERYMAADLAAFGYKFERVA